MAATSTPATVANAPARKGELAARARRFGPFGRYSVAPVHTRFDAVEWFVWDAQAPDASGAAGVIRQAATEAEAIAGLEFTPPEDHAWWPGYVAATRRRSALVARPGGKGAIARLTDSLFMAEQMLMRETGAPLHLIQLRAELQAKQRQA